MNLPFTVTEEEINTRFSAYGNVENVFIPKDRNSGSAKGYAYVMFTTAESAIDAFAHLDKVIFQGRKLHILPAQKKPEEIQTKKELLLHCHIIHRSVIPRRYLPKKTER